MAILKDGRNCGHAVRIVIDVRDEDGRIYVDDEIIRHLLHA